LTIGQFLLIYINDNPTKLQKNILLRSMFVCCSLIFMSYDNTQYHDDMIIINNYNYYYIVYNRISIT
jgi:hypothetical protein